MNFEVRYKGALLTHFDKEREASAYRDKRLADPIEGPAFAPADLTVAPRRPISLFCNGNLVDTFLSASEATERRDAILKKHLAEQTERKGRPAMGPALDDFEITKNRTATPKKATG